MAFVVAPHRCQIVALLVEREGNLSIDWDAWTVIVTRPTGLANFFDWTNDGGQRNCSHYSGESTKHGQQPLQASCAATFHLI